MCAINFWLGKHVSNFDANLTSNSARASSPSSIAKDQTTRLIAGKSAYSQRDDAAFMIHGKRVLAEPLDGICGVGWTCSHR
jgi:hypothetical protein